MKLLQRFIIIFICLINTIASNGQKAYRDHYTTEQGLSHNFVYCVFKDSRGVIWAATQSGLNCFNGNTWQKFDAEKGQIAQKSNDYLFIGICEDELKNLYFCTYGYGVYVYNWGTRKVTKICKKSMPQLPSDLFLNCGYTKGKVYLLNASSVEILEASSLRYLSRLTQNKDAKNNYLDILLDNDTINILTNNLGIQQFIGNTNIGIIAINDKRPTLQEFEKHNFKYFVATNRGIWMCKGHELIKLNVQFKGQNISNEDFLGLGKSNGQLYFLSNAKGILLLEDINRNTLYLKEDSNSTQLLKEGTFNSNHSDTINNNIVVGMSNGVSFINHVIKPFQYFEPEGELKSSALCFYSLNDSIFLLGTQKGLLAYNIFSKKSRLVHNMDGDNFIYSIKKIRGQILLFTAMGVYCFDNFKIHQQVSSAIQPFVRDNFSIIIELNDSIYCLKKMNEDQVYIWNLSTNRIVKQKFLFNELNGNAVLGNKTLYATGSGLYYYNTRSEKYVEIPLGHAIKNCIGVHKIGNKLYAILSGVGIFEIDSSLNSKLIEPIENAIEATSLYKDKIVLTTSENIVLFNPEQPNEVKYFLPSDGYQNNSFNQRAIQIFGNKLFIGQVNGFSIFDPLVTNVLRENNKILIQDVSYYFKGIYILNNKIEFKYNQNTILIRLACTNYLQTDRNVIWYRINEQEWISLRMDKELYLNQLAPGKYKIDFMLDKKLNTGSKILTYSFDILPPWYKTWWFRLLLFLSTSALLFGASRYYYANELKKKQLHIEKLEAVEQERQRMSADLHDDIGSHISTVQLLAKRLSSKDDNDSNYEFKTSIAELGQKIREVIWVTKSENDSLENFLLYIRKYIVKQLDLADFGVKMNLPAIVPDYNMSSIMRRDLLMCVKECVNNIIKHSQASDVEVECSIVDDVITIVISDNGIGLKNMNSFGNGLKQMDERLKRYGGAYEIKKENKTVSEIKFKLQ
jgi:signal transduction histidine kinase